MEIREQQHRLPKDRYRGILSGSFTLCIKNDALLFVDPNIVKLFTEILESVALKSGCIVPVYCFMPDHQHLILSGTDGDADLWKTIVAYKQRTGYWLAKHRPAISWQKDFYDHIIRSDENLATQIRYVLDNPVRKGLVASWHEYPYKGSLGCSLDNVLNAVL